MSATIEDVQIGWWWAMCCLRDLYPIRTAEDLANVRGYLGDDGDGPLCSAWPTLDLALAALAPYEDPTEVEALVQHVRMRANAPRQV